MSEQEEFYPMPMFAILNVGDLEASTRWYRDTLGFRVVFTMPGPNGEPAPSHLRWIKYADLLLVQDREPQASSSLKGAGVNLNFMAEDQRVDDLAKRYVDRGVNIVTGPITQPWNTRELTVSDPDGYRLTFFEQARSGLTMGEVTENINRQSAKSE